MVSLALAPGAGLEISNAPRPAEPINHSSPPHSLPQPHRDDDGACRRVIHITRDVLSERTKSGNSRCGDGYVQPHGRWEKSAASFSAQRAQHGARGRAGGGHGERPHQPPARWRSTPLCPGTLKGRTPADAATVRRNAGDDGTIQQCHKVKVDRHLNVSLSAGRNIHTRLKAHKAHAPTCATRATGDSQPTTPTALLHSHCLASLPKSICRPRGATSALGQLQAPNTPHAGLVPSSSHLEAPSPCSPLAVAAGTPPPQ